MKITVTSHSGPPDPAVVQEVEQVDQSLRQSFSGFAEDVVVPEVERSFGQLSISPSPDVIAAYARAIGERADFVLEID